MRDYIEHIISDNADARGALKKLEYIHEDNSRTLFVVDDSGQMRGTITDGDIRRALLNGVALSANIKELINDKIKNFRLP